MVFSQKGGDWTEVTATFVDDLVEAWISKDIFEQLQLDLIPGSPGDPEWGFLDKKSVSLGGRAELQWFPRERRKVKDTTCRIVDSKRFGIYLQAHLLPSSPESEEKPGRVVASSSPEVKIYLPTSPPRKHPKVGGDSPLSGETLDTGTVNSKDAGEQNRGNASLGSFDGLPETISETSDEYV